MAELELGVTCPVTWVTICEEGSGDAEDAANIFAAPGGQEVAAD